MAEHSCVFGLLAGEVAAFYIQTGDAEIRDPCETTSPIRCFQAWMARPAAALKKLDKNGDGKLTREELSKMAEQFSRGFGGGRGGQGGGEGGRPDRPQRPK